MHSYRANEPTRRNVQVGVWSRSRSRRSSSERREGKVGENGEGLECYLWVAVARRERVEGGGSAETLLESTTFPGAKDTRERAGNTGKFLSLVPTLGISHSGEKSRENIGFPACFQKTHGNYYNFLCVMIPECFKGTHRNYYSLPCVLISECFKGTHGNLL